MVFSLRQKQQYCFSGLQGWPDGINANDQFLADNIGDQVLLGRVDMVGKPKNADPFEEGENDLGNGFFDALGLDIAIQHRFYTTHIHIYHVLDQFIDDPLLLGLGLGK